MRLRQVETCSLTWLTSDSIRIWTHIPQTPKSMFSVLLPCYLLFHSSFNVHLLYTRGTTSRVYRTGGWVCSDRKPSANKCWECEIQPCCTVWNTQNHDDLASVPGGPGSACQMLTESALKLQPHLPISETVPITLLVNQSQVWLLPFPAPGTVNPEAASRLLHEGLSLCLGGHMKRA